MILGIGITNKCNLNCLHCSKSLGLKELEADEIFKTIDFLDQQCLEEIKVGITGGEPFLHTQIDSILEFLNVRNKPYNISTNGLLWDNYKSLISGNKNCILNLSLEGISPMEVDSIRGEGYYEHFCDLINDIQNLNVRYGINYTILKSNINCIKEMCDAPWNRRAEFVTFSTLFPTQKTLDKQELLNLNDYKIIGEEIRAPYFLTHPRFERKRQFPHP